MGTKNIVGELTINGNNVATEESLANYLPKSGGTITGDLYANKGITIEAGTGVKLNSKDDTQFMLYGNKLAQNMFIRVQKSDGSYGYGKLIDIDTKLYSQNKEVAIKEDIPTKTSQLTNDSGFLVLDTDGGVPTERLFKDALVMDDFGHSATETSVDSDGIYYSTDAVIYGQDDAELSTLSMAHTLPIVAGDGIDIEVNDDGKAEIKAPLVYSGYMLASHYILNNANNTDAGRGVIEAPITGFNRTPQVGEGFRALVFDDGYGNIGSAYFTIKAKSAQYAMCTMTSVVTNVFASKPNIVSLSAGTGTSASTVVLKLDFPAEAFIQRGRVQSSTALNPTLETVMQTIQFFLVSSGMTNTATTSPANLTGSYIFYPASGFLKGSVVGEIVGVFSTGINSGTTLGVVFKTNTGTSLAKTIITITTAYISAVNMTV